MCGRYVSARPVAEIAATFGVPPSCVEAALEPDYNVAPTKSVYAVVHRDRGEPTRELKVMRWGLVPPWAKDPSIGARLINARAETVASKPAFRRAFARRRCLLPADGFYEWWQPDQSGARKQPFFIRPRDRAILALAGLYEFWRADQTSTWLVTTTVLTTDAPDELGRIHQRAPLLIEPDGWAEWLDPKLSGEAVAPLLIPAVPGRLEAYPVDALVNNVRNNSKELIEPLSAG
ncbi:MAG: SOS response-associated peptidase [Mycobacteriales bacterium]